ncbi:uncharacterized protein T551_01691 [Pneumocystis jirovecii RU7]|uniref:RNA helicase n=1 Tax=Pneumocystis jirovecii (strain RU7) TaxID=1408657 RepID=A0A0W4ZPV6_PNEJ7|nr:uncharacterized protein T551_01691 [Pneumocystis jirovecii RU7]KTW30408.1 hypothetical protein T551_01691 [Pneumocystis jirovecii RU7]
MQKIKKNKNRKIHLKFLKGIYFKSNKSKKHDFYAKENITNDKKQKTYDNQQKERTKKVNYEEKYDKIIKDETKRIKKHNFFKTESELLLQTQENKIINKIKYQIKEKKSKKEQDKRRTELLKDRMKLPIWSARLKLIEEMENSRVIILLGEPGSGKSTQLPQFLLKSNYTKNSCIAITQPRRIAAVNLAKRVSEEMGTSLGSKVGYSIRFDDCSSSHTQIKYMTDGMLLRELIGDPLLSLYSTIILDEAHERTLITDILMGFLKKIMKLRPTLTIVIMSATLEAERFSTFFDNAKVCFIKGRQYPVDIHHTLQPENDYVDAVLRTIFQIHINEPEGDILAFLTGQDEIESLETSISHYSKQLQENVPKMFVCTLFSALPQNIQQKAFVKTPPNTRKIILATNIAETSVTVKGVKYVIDTGLVKVKHYNNRLGIEALHIEPVSKSSARQRAGRAGREGPGKCYRLYTESEFKKLKNTSTPEIKRINLSFAVLTLKARGEDDLMNFKFVDPPSHSSLLRSLEHLYSLSALDKNGKITKIGYDMSLIPLSPQLARVLIAAANDYNCLSCIIDIIACISTENLFISPQNKKNEANEARMKFFSRDGDHITYLNIIRQFIEIRKNESIAKTWCHQNFINFRAITTIMEIRKQLTKHCKNANMKVEFSNKIDTELILQCFLTGFFMNTALLQTDGNYYTTIGNTIVHIHPSSVLFNRKVEAILYNNLIFTTKPYVHIVSMIKSDWLRTISQMIQNNNS